MSSALKALRTSGRASVTRAMPSANRRGVDALGHAALASSRRHPNGAWDALYCQDEGRRDARRSTATRSLTRASHWLWVLAFAVLVSSGLQIFNAAPYLDASDKSNPARRVLAIGVAGGRRRHDDDLRAHVRDDGLARLDRRRHGRRRARARSRLDHVPGYQDLADGRRWHFFFAWIAALCWLAW